jgi:hypothetical protein
MRVAVVYGGSSGPEAEGEHLWLRTYEGSVRAHPDLHFWVDPRGHLHARRADLAAIFLDEPVPEQLAKVLLSGSEVRQGEALIMAGYGQDDDKLLYEQGGDRLGHGAHVHEHLCPPGVGAC